MIFIHVLAHADQSIYMLSKFLHALVVVVQFFLALSPNNKGS